MDKLKKLIENRREEFDIHDLDFNNSWQEIESSLDKRKRVVEIKWLWRVAAAFIIGVSITAMVYAMNIYLSPSSGLAYQESPEWTETEKYYSDKVNEKIQAIHSRNVNLDEVIMEDMNLLDQAYADLKDDLADDADNDEVISAMILNYQIKLKILERILVEIQVKDDAEQNEESFNL